MKERITILLVCLTLSACGIKPQALDAPDGKETNFPHTYPAEHTDPRPPPQPTTIDIEPMTTDSESVVTY